MPIAIRTFAGASAQDKDVARRLRLEQIFPDVRSNRVCTLDFQGVVETTQSFVHALISEVCQEFGERSLELLEFASCAPDIQTLIATVVDYSIPIAYLAENDSGRAALIPQSDNLRLVRDVVVAVGAGCGAPSEIGAATGFTDRHVGYRLRAAEALSLIVVGRRIGITPLGRELLNAPEASCAEQEVLHMALSQSFLVRLVVPELLRPAAPKRALLATRLVRRYGFSAATASRRAQTLLAWRRYVMVPQLDLFQEE